MHRITDATEQQARYMGLLLQYFGITGEDDEAAFERYMAHVAEQYRTISFLFVNPRRQREGVATEAELEAVFVPLQVQDPRGMQSEERPFDSAQGDRVNDEGRGERDDLLTINEVLAEYPVFLLEGAPGSGKTTLLRHVATSLARGQGRTELNWQGEPLLPILVPLRNFGRFLQQHEKEYTNPLPLALREFIEDFFKEHDLNLPANFFHDRLQQGNCLLLLDGLDEVADRGVRTKVARIVSKFIETYGKRGNRFGLASRPQGYAEVAPYLPKPVVCKVQPLRPEQRDQLVWNVLQQFPTAGKKQAQERTELLQDLARKPHLDEMSRNPLFCTTLVLVFKYRSANLPERRVDVYQELVRLMLGFWDTARSEVADVRGLALLDGTGQEYESEEDAVEAKERALQAVASWMQHAGKAEVTANEVHTFLGNYFVQWAGAPEADKLKWARGFLRVIQQRSGLYVEANPERYAFSHKHFLEYLAAGALINLREGELRNTLLAHAGDSWWEEVILLALAHEALADGTRAYLLQELLEAGHVVLAGKCAQDAGQRVAVKQRQRIEGALHAQMVDGERKPTERYAAGEVLDTLGWLPPDLNGWVRCPACADDGQDLLVMKYPVTNSQYELFVKTGGYDNPDYWSNEGWEWRLKLKWTEPRLWYDVRMGIKHRGYPIIGISWYEAEAYIQWLNYLCKQTHCENTTIPLASKNLLKGVINVGSTKIRLPTEWEWARVAGGEQNNRYTWDKTQEITTDEAKILKRANVRESNISRTSPVSMYPQGISEPYNLWDMNGNVWEWTSSLYDKDDKTTFVIRGGAWNIDHRSVRVAFRYWDFMYIRGISVGMRLVAPMGSDS